MLFEMMMDHARKQGKIAALTYVGQSDPIDTMQWFFDLVNESSQHERNFPGYYEEFSESLNEEIIKSLNVEKENVDAG